MVLSRRITRRANGREIPGTYLRAFIHNGGMYFVTEIRIYQDGMIDCWELVDLEGFKQKVAQGWVVTQLPEDAHVSISSLVDFQATAVSNWIREADFIDEVADEIEALNGRPTTSDHCRAAFEHYIDDPSEPNRGELRDTYEAVPEHLRRYLLGDMDTKDSAIRAILYGTDEQRLNALEFVRDRRRMDRAAEERRRQRRDQPPGC
jgi:hypothetical protein